MPNRKKYLLTGLIAIVAVPVAYLLWSWSTPLNFGQEKIVVKPGMSMQAFNSQLYDRGLLPDSWSLVWLARLRGDSRKLKAGEYRFKAGISLWQLLDQVISGRVVEYPFLVIEGWTFKQIREALANSSHIRKTLAGMGEKEIMTALGHPDMHPEGRFYPDTYHYSSGSTDMAILQRAFEKMQKLLQQEWETRSVGLPLKTPDEALTLASIIEKETGLVAERSLIAGVFINRLRKNMRLQTDPTVIYGMGDTFDGNLRRHDLRKDTPYNTYTRRGLPPTPIAMPGRDAIHAALNPADTDALYFVARGDGSHEFSPTIEAHNKAVIKYQLKGRRKRPPPAQSENYDHQDG